MRDWDHVATAIRSRRIAEGRTQQEMAERAGVSLATWRLLETAGRTRYQDLTLRGVTRALGWGPDAIERLLAGEDPGPQGESLRHERTTEDPEVPVGLARRWGQLTGDEQAKVLGFVEGLFAGRAD
jgi:transcriptional regulator with XRE-family HTH domain